MIRIKCRRVGSFPTGPTCGIGAWLASDVNSDIEAYVVFVPDDWFRENVGIDLLANFKRKSVRGACHVEKETKSGGVEVAGSRR